MRIRNWPIRLRAVALATLPALITVVLLTTLHMMERWSDANRSSESTVKLMIESISASAEYPVISGNYDLLLPLIKAALNEPEIAYVRIVSPQGETLIEEKTAEFGDINPESVQVLRRTLLRDVVELDGFSEFGELMVMTQELAVVEVGMTDYFTRGRDLAILYQSLLTGFLVVLLAGVTARYSSLMIAGPIESVGRFISRLAEGEFWHRTQVDDGAEVGRLQENSNRLAETLELARQEQKKFTERLMAEQSVARKASASKSKFLAMMSHELRTPLNGALGMLQLLDQEQPGDEFTTQKNQAQESLEHLTQLLDDIMIVADTDQPASPVSAEPCQLGTYLEPLFEDLRLRAMSKGLSFIAEVAPALRREAVVTQPAMLRQLLRHLTDNALKFTRHGLVSVSITPAHHGGLQVTVTDTGIGIPEDKYDQVLEPFTQLAAESNREFGGVGLGLTISAHIVRILGGSMSFAPQSGGGTVVRISLPELVLAPNKDGDESNEAGHGRILIVEDNEINLKVAEKMLRKVGPELEISSVGSGEACLSLMARETFDLIMLDCQMPGMDGFETAQRLRESGYDGIIVACTANTTDRIESRCLESGMNDYMSKPIRLDGVKQMLGQWMGRLAGNGPSADD